MEAAGSSTAGILEKLNRLENAARGSLDGACSYLKLSFKNDTAGNAGWSQFLNETDKPPSVAGTAHGVLAMLACGEHPDSEIISLALRFLELLQCEDGGWTKPSLQNKSSLTRITALSLRALLDSKTHHSTNAVKNGVSWLLKAQNNDGGWGNTTKDDQSDVTSTSFALQALTKIIGLTPDQRSGIQKAQAWLSTTKNADHSWGLSQGKPGKVAQTSEAVDGLLACGVIPASLKPTEEWLKQHIKDERQFNERYLIPAGPCKDDSVIWTQVSKERGLITLLLLGSSIVSPAVTDAAQDILSRQINGTYWSGDAFENAEPIWAVKEATVALRRLLQHIERDRASLVLSEAITGLRPELAAAQRQIAELLARETQRTWKGRFDALSQTMRKPRVASGIIILLSSAAYAIFRQSQSMSILADILAAIASFVGLALTVYQIVHDSRRGGK